MITLPCKHPTICAGAPSRREAWHYAVCRHPSRGSMRSSSRIVRDPGRPLACRPRGHLASAPDLTTGLGLMTDEVPRHHENRTRGVRSLYPSHAEGDAPGRTWRAQAHNMTWRAYAKPRRGFTSGLWITTACQNNPRGTPSVEPRISKLNPCSCTATASSGRKEHDPNDRPSCQ